MLAQNTRHPHMCIRCTNKTVRYLALFRRLLWRHCKTFNINAGKPKFYSSAVVYFTLADLLETKKRPSSGIVIFDPFCFCLFWWKIRRYYKAVGRIWQSKKTISFLYTVPNYTEEQQHIIDNTWKLQLPKTTVYFSKQNSTFVAEFNSNLKISGGVGGRSSPPCLSPCIGHEDWVESNRLSTFNELTSIMSRNDSNLYRIYLYWNDRNRLQ